MSAHLGDLVSAYVDRTLPPEQQHALDRHVVSCQVCRAVADAERRILGSLRHSGTPGVPTSLTALLHGLGAVPPAGDDVVLSGPVTGSATGTALGSVRVLPLVSPGAPPLHRSPLRAAVLAGLVAGASTAAAWGIGATGAAAVTHGSTGSTRAAGSAASLSSGSVASPLSGGVLSPAITMLAALPVAAVGSMSGALGPHETQRSGRGGQSQHD